MSLENIYGICIESATKNCSIAIYKNNELLCLCEEDSDEYKHAEKLHLFINWALEGAEISINQINYMAIGHGPGSYTGLRIGTSAAKGFSYALNVPLISLNSLELLVEKYKYREVDFIIPMIDARRMEVYCLIYEVKKTTSSFIEAKIIDEYSFSNLTDKKVLFIGSGVEKCQPFLKGKNYEFELNINPSAKEMGFLAYTKYLKQDFEDIAYFEPLYLKDFITTKPKN